MKSGQRTWIMSLGRFAKAIVLWTMLVSGIVLATRQARAFHYHQIKADQIKGVVVD